MTLPVAILAGGRGTRLGAAAGSIPKSLVDVAGKPFIVHQLELLRRSGIERVVVCAGHLGEMLQEALGGGETAGFQLEYAFDGPTPLGTGGALKRALPLLGPVFFVLYGDSYLNVDYRGVAATFKRSGRLGLMTVNRNEGRWDASNVAFVDGRIVRYEKGAPAPDLLHIDYGLSVFMQAAFDDVPAGRFTDLADVYRDLIARDQLAGFEVKERFYEIGSPQGLAETRSYLSKQESP